jgi:hypothetical protein
MSVTNLLLRCLSPWTCLHSAGATWRRPLHVYSGEQPGPRTLSYGSVSAQPCIQFHMRSVLSFSYNWCANVAINLKQWCRQLVQARPRLRPKFGQSCPCTQNPGIFWNEGTAFSLNEAIVLLRLYCVVLTGTRPPNGTAGLGFGQE